MDITVIIPSRGRTRLLSTVLTSLNLLESGNHKVTYAVCCDDDDPRTSLFCAGMQKDIPLAFWKRPRPESLGGIINDMAEAVPGDVYVLAIDDILPLTLNWDEVVAQAVKDTPYGVFWWTNKLPDETTIPVVTETWRKAAGHIYTNHYPFWYDDLCLLELWLMTTGQEAIRPGIEFVDRPKTTMRMRDLKFWQQFFLKTRKLRIQEAKIIAKNLGLPAPKYAEQLAERLDGLLKPASDEELERIQSNQGDMGEPDPAYLRAKARAEAFLQTL